MSKGAKIFIGVLCVAFSGFLIWALATRPVEKTSLFETLDPLVLHEGHVETGNGSVDLLEEHVKGDLETAELVLYEYADYQCPGCATVNPWVNALLEEYSGRVAVVFRNYLLSYHANARSSAAAANAAGLQGYWKEYADYLFANQSSWESLTGSVRTKYFEDALAFVSEGRADLEKFASDLSSDAVSAKIDYDHAMGTKLALSSTPAFYYEGAEIDWYDKVQTDEDFLNYWRTFFNEHLEKK
ncbi:thioredoxin domain-containing protein [Candidatus Saccharibacteria bacterium]|nr:thioredoxin domain-containing protein [Candidatus Saccharibacteria bacterium]